MKALKRKWGKHMFNGNRKYILVLLLFAFAFVYRIVLMLWPAYPSGADIGLHASVINSITQSGNTNFLYNFYQMGGGISLTFPGYHIFASEIIVMTGLSDYLAQAIIVALFSSFIVLAAYLVTRAAWTESGALIVAFLVAVSRFDIEMLMWGGYPNVITLFLIPLTFYLFLQRGRFSTAPFIVSTSILAGSIFLTHSLSAVIFVTVTVATALFVLIRPTAFGASRKTFLSWLAPLVLGAVLVSPFLAEAANAYFHSNSTLNTASDINSAILSTKLIPLEIVVPLFAILILFFFLSKEYRGRYLSVPAFLFFMWLLVPLILSQGYLYGLYIDYNRFLYFLLLPVIVLLGMFIDHGSIVFARLIDNYRTLTSQMHKSAQSANKYAAHISRRITRKNLYIVFVAGILLASMFLFQLLVTPWQGAAVQSFYQVMDSPGYQAIQWAKDNTPTGSVFVSDALYGWWLGGFAQRPTLSAVDPQYLTDNRELAPAKNASLLLDTDYMIDNGLIQVREDGGYTTRHNPEILTDLNWTYFPYSFFNFDSNQIEIDYTVNRTTNQKSASNLTVDGMEMQMGPNNQSATIIVSRSNDLLSYTQFTTVYQDSKFVNITAIVNTKVSGVSLNYLSYQVESKGTPIPTSSNTLAWIDEGVKALGQLIFIGNQPHVQQTVNNAPPYNFNIQYALNSASEGKIEFAATTYSVSDKLDIYTDQNSINNYFTPIIEANLNMPQQTNDKPLTTFDYLAALQYYNVSYIVNRVADVNPKFAGDPNFSLVFINDKVAIFKVS